ncbi:hypothetical protein CDD83_8191 [Cordyceps sp. RAO-2017]|nr:hypothetical protein CDD83_8191 [Cordyceps sp. RAO-2017]
MYFTNWGIYSAGFQPYQIPADRITHLFYAFALADENGTVISSDPYADLNKMYTGDTREEGPNAYGCIKQLYIKKKHNRHLKTVLSIGGYNFSLKGNFARLAATAAGRRNFCTSAVELMRDWGMDGLDIDWEYPNDDTEATNLILLLQECREALDRLATTQEQRYHYLLTAATSAGPEKYGKMNLTAMDPLLDSWNLMAYDFAGSWDSTTGHQANVYPDRNNMVSTKFHTDKAVTDYMAAHIPPEKITLGLPLYGRSFAQTQGLGRSYSGTGAKPEREGTWRYHELPRPGAKAEFDDRIGAAWSYSRTTGELVTHDTLDSTQFKARYIRSKGLGGAFFWEAAGDKKGEDSLVSAMARALTPLDDSPNMLSYPDSRYLNIRNNMPGA